MFRSVRQITHASGRYTTRNAKSWHAKPYFFLRHGCRQSAFLSSCTPLMETCRRTNRRSHSGIHPPNQLAIRPRLACMQSTSTSTSNFSRIKQQWSKYGWVFVGTYLGIEFSCLFLLFAGASNGLLTPENLDSILSLLGFDAQEQNMDIVDQYIALAKLFGVERFVDIDQMKSMDPRTAHLAGSFVVAYIANKVIEPPRLAVSLMLTPSLARYIKANF